MPTPNIPKRVKPKRIEAEQVDEPAFEPSQYALSTMNQLPHFADRLTFSANEVAKMIGTAPEVIRAHVRDGGIRTLPRHTMCARILIPRLEVLRLLDEGLPFYEYVDEHGHPIDDDEAA